MNLPLSPLNPPIVSDTKYENIKKQKKRREGYTPFPHHTNPPTPHTDKRSRVRKPKREKHESHFKNDLSYDLSLTTLNSNTSPQPPPTPQPQLAGEYPPAKPKPYAPLLRRRAESHGQWRTCPTRLPWSKRRKIPASPPPPSSRPLSSADGGRRKDARKRRCC